VKKDQRPEQKIESERLKLGSKAGKNLIVILGDIFLSPAVRAIKW